MSDIASLTLPDGCTSCHCWLVGPIDRTRRWVRARQGDPDGSGGIPVSIFDCRPAGGDDEPVATPALVSHVVPWMLEHDPAGVRRTLSTVYTLAPGLMTRPDEDPPSSHHGREMNRGELLRLGHGLCELLHSWGAAAGSSTVVFEEAQCAGAVDSMLIAQVLGELPPELVRIVVCSTTDRVHHLLRGALERLPRSNL